jgi:hypothetical protein
MEYYEFVLIFIADTPRLHQIALTSELDIEFESTGRGRLIYIMNRSTRSLYIKGDPV